LAILPNWAAVFSRPRVLATDSRQSASGVVRTYAEATSEFATAQMASEHNSTFGRAWATELHLKVRVRQISNFSSVIELPADEFV
jgi:hypothetical protein